MEILSVIAAAAVSFVIGAVWYMALSKPWAEAAGIELDDDGNPVPNGSPAKPFIICGIALLIVAGMMRHMFAMAGIEAPIKGLLSGFGIGLFFITAWMTFSYAFAGRPTKLAIIDGGYATLGCSAMGLVLCLF